MVRSHSTRRHAAGSARRCAGGLALSMPPHIALSMLRTADRTPQPGPPMPRIAIVGSCITRDLWPIGGGGAEALLYISRTSFPGLLSTPVQGFRPDAELPGDLHLHEHKALVADLRKTTLTTLMAYRPTHVIFDFI